KALQATAKLAVTALAATINTRDDFIVLDLRLSCGGQALLTMPVSSHDGGARCVPRPSARRHSA
ncbi:MAG: hypothetical protein J0I81_02985, partial [Hyphomicrobium sp.]|nr:hypothetical protein [Hyphomicrobium sp.]